MTVSAEGSRANRRYTLFLLTSVFTLNIVDRGLIMLLLQPIKEELHLNDSQLGLLTGIVFGFFYAVCGLPLSRLADKGDRVTLTSIAIGLWSITVMSCVFVRTYAQLALARMFAAVGEAGCIPPTYSLIGDYFPGPVERTRAMTAYWLGSPLASLISFGIGGWLNDHFGWRMTFFFMGIPGVVLAIVAKLTISEPRKAQSSTQRAVSTLPAMRSVLATLWGCDTTRHLTVALILLYTVAFGIAPWYAPLMMRIHGMGTTEVGTLLGVIFCVTGILGVLFGGYVSTSWFASQESRQLKATAAAVAAMAPSLFAFVTLPGKYAALTALGVFTLVLNFFLAPGYALLQRLVADDMRATTLAVVLMSGNLIGMGVGPQIVGIVSDALQPMVGVHSLSYGMALMCGVALWSAHHFLKASRTVESDLASVSSTSSPQSSVQDSLSANCTSGNSI